MISIDFNKIKSFLTFSNTCVKDSIAAYYHYIDCNSFEDLTCPNCKHKNCLKYHKSYDRNLIYIEDNTIIDITITIAVCICEYCNKCHNTQKYHALLPIFIFPYHIYEASLIINSLFDYLYKKEKIKTILERLSITHKLFYDWLFKLKKYLLSSSIIIKIKNDVVFIIEQIYALNHHFLIAFYHEYNHPFFLFKNTCVPLSIIP